MFSLAYPLTESVEIDGVTYSLDLSFDNVLRLIDLMGDQEIDDVTQVETGLEMLLNVCFLFDIEKQGKLLSSLFEKVLAVGEEDEQAVDIKGNPMPSAQGDQKESYSLTEDANYIYASFLQCYDMDLHEQQGKLHWEKFKALLGGLSEDTIFRKVIDIRTMPLPTGKGTEKERENIKKLKKAYALKGQEIDFDDEDEDQ
ncbi:Gp15 family bacteriophage protein [Bacillus sp. FSL K6-3431]|uniref:Gp15 family bacteriophage protein n=1 Tax=Bacillus sp. FSL K6-3431 TaxID=2921500 RepID=UPI0030F9DCBA